MRTALAVAGACLAAVTARPSPAAADAPYLRATTCRNDPAAGQALWWGGMPVRWSLSSHHVPPACKDLATLEAHADAALGQWPAATAAGGSAPCTFFAFQYQGSADAIRIGNDGVNLLVYRQGSCALDVGPGDPCHVASTCANVYNCWEQPGDTVLALTWATYDTVTGQILDADIEFHDWDGSHASTANGGYAFTCGGPASSSCGSNAAAVASPLTCTWADVDTIATHESGHVLGLDHPCAAGPNCTQVMAPSVLLGVRKRTPTADDVAGVCAIYPAATGVPWREKLPGTCGRRGCGCGGDPAPLALALLAPLLLRPRPRRIDGSGGAR